MSRPRYIITDANTIPALINLCAALTDALPEGSDDRQRAEDAVTSISAALVDPESPFLRYRKEILGDYTTAERLRALTMHLWNSGRPVDLARLVRNADAKHAFIALEMIASYAAEGENDPAFMRLADELNDMQRAAA